MQEVRIYSSLTNNKIFKNRNYLARMNDEKVVCMIRAKKYDYDYWDGEKKYGYGGYNFKERFINKFNLPDYVFLNDQASFEKIKSLHPSIESKLIVGGNPIFTSFKKKIKLKKTKKKKLFFLLVKSFLKNLRLKKLYL